MLTSTFSDVKSDFRRLIVSTDIGSIRLMVQFLASPILQCLLRTIVQLMVQPRILVHFSLDKTVESLSGQHCTDYRVV